MSEEKSSLRLLFEFNAAAIAIPIIVLLAVFGYSKLFGVYITKKIWKTVFFIAWSGTLLVFFREFLKSLFAYLLRRPKTKSRLLQIDAGEQRKAVVISREIALAAISIPLIACALVYIANQYADLNFKTKDWRLVVLILWIGTIVSLIKLFISKR